MPGSKTSQLLSSGKYETFYHLAHALSEYVLLRMVTIRTQAQFLTRLIATIPSGEKSRVDHIEQIENAASQLEESTQRIVEEVRCFFWPRLAFESGFHEANRQRWAPYDAQAWDAFFTDFTSFITPRLEEIAVCLERLRTFETLQGMAPRSAKADTWTVGMYIPDQAYQELLEVLKPASFEELLLG